MAGNIPILELEGTPHERGLAHGRAFKEQIREFADSVVGVHQANNSYLKVKHQSLQGFCMNNLGFLEKFSPDLLDEMHGIAEGAGLGFEEILLLNCFLELEDLRAPGLGGKILPDSLWGCTSFNIPPEVSENGTAYIGQTFDMEQYYQKYLILLRIKSADGPDALVLSLAGVLALNGINEAGIGMVINKVTATDARPGVIYPFIVRQALGCERIGDALGTVIFTPRATGITYQLCAKDVAFCAETSATRYELLNCDNGLTHTNHYVGGEMLQFETPHWLSHGGSMVRKQVADKFLKQWQGRLGPEALQQLMQDHTNHPRCICAHGFPGESEQTAFHTIFGVVMSPEEHWLEVCPGNPCQHAFVRYAL